MDIELPRGMKIGMISIAGVLFCTSAAADEGLAGLADPTRPAIGYTEAGEPVPAGPVLQSTMIAPGNKRAMISGKIYTVGDNVGGAVVADIHPYEVILNRGGRVTRLRLVPSLAKEAVKPATAKGDKP